MNVLAISWQVGESGRPRNIGFERTVTSEVSKAEQLEWIEGFEEFKRTIVSPFNRIKPACLICPIEKANPNRFRGTASFYSTT